LLAPNDRKLLARSVVLACDPLDPRAMLLKCPGYVGWIGSLGIGQIAQAGPFDPTDNSVLPVEHREEDSFILRQVELAGGIGNEGHSEASSIVWLINRRRCSSIQTDPVAITEVLVDSRVHASR
jgi:hypothetical protein